MHNPEFNPFLNAARKLKAQGFRQGWNPHPAYMSLIRCFREMNSAARLRISFEAASLLARLLFLRCPLSFVSYICVSDYVGGTRFKAQNGRYILTSGERIMLERAEQLRDEAQRLGVVSNWRLILADGWGMELFGDRCVPGALDLYCEFIESELRKRGFEAVRWSRLMRIRQDYENAYLEALPSAEALAAWESKHGEIAHDRPDPRNAGSLAVRHIQMRAAETRVVVAEYGPTLVLSTETRKLVRYDNLLIPRDSYAHLFVMPFYPHRLP